MICGMNGKRGESVTKVQELDGKIETLRARLLELAQKKDYNFLNTEVTRLSEQLDVLIVQRERCKIINK